MSIDELQGSVLGTQEYWENCYERDIDNYRKHGDVGEIWFDEDAQLRIINYIVKQPNIPLESRTVDLGCGNGMFLIEMARKGYKNLVGIDYVPNAIDMAASIARSQNLSIDYMVADLMDVEACQTKLGLFDIVHDKGTYDAISLCPVNPHEKRQLYIKSVSSLMKPNAIFVITSCNWTEQELVKSFEGLFTKTATIPTPQFQFGGKIGTLVSSLVFQLTSSTAVLNSSNST